MDAAFGQRFCVVNRPPGRLRGLVLLVPPLLEELNKSRRMCALAARAFADAGLLVMRMDLHGSGDSSGTLVEVTWQTWVDDVQQGVTWLRSQGEIPLFLWAVRGGALLAGDWLRRGGRCNGLLLWHPVVDGRRNILHFLRVGATAGLQDDTRSRVSASELLSRLERGADVEVAGYQMARKMAEGWSQSRLELAAGYAGSVAVMELTTTSNSQPSRALAEWLARCADVGQAVLYQNLAGAAFWQTQEIEVSLPLIEASCAVLDGWANAQ